MSLPNFMCIGAAKSGTTSLYDILRQHSDVFIPSFKEPHFFNIPAVYENGLSWYEKTYFNGVKNEKCIGDFTPTYLFDKYAPERILALLGGGVKFIIILRNPVDRAYSHYLHSKRDLHEYLSFENALKKKVNENNNYLTYLRNSYVEQGKYADMLERYFALFSRDNFLILHFEEDFVLEREQTMVRIFKFLNLKDGDFDFNIRSNKASKAKFIWLKNLMKKSGWWRQIIKKMLPSLKLRQIIKNRIQRLNTTILTPPKLSNEERENILNDYFCKDIKTVERLLSRKMNWK
tara:strand:+ start:589 stop:1458 length:870 start_codon:yes stop_codon:yes gene_type:complete